MLSSEYYKIYPWSRTYSNIKQRCNNPRAPYYSYYGGKGIKCLITIEELKTLWFRDGADKMKQPSIDRRNHAGNYEFSNCRFIEQNKNIVERNIRVRSRKVYQYSLDNKLLKEWPSVILAGKDLGISVGRICGVCLKYKYHKSAGGFIWSYQRRV